MFFSLMPKIVLTFFFFKLYFFIFNFEIEFFSTLFFICGSLSLFIGIFNAMYQYKIKRFLAYSSISTVGFVLISFSTMTLDGFFGGLYFIFTYLFSVVLFFFILLNIRKNNLKEFNELFELSLLNSFNYFILFMLFILSVISSFYYLRVIRFIYFNKISEYNFYYYFNLNYIFFFIFYFNIVFFFFFFFFLIILSNFFIFF